MASEAWRVLKVDNPLNAEAVKLCVDAHIEQLKTLYNKRATFNGQIIVKDGVCWGKFVVGTPKGRKKQ